MLSENGNQYFLDKIFQKYYEYLESIPNTQFQIVLLKYYPADLYNSILVSFF